MYTRNNNGAKTQTCGTPDSTLTSLLLQSSTITCCDWFDGHCQYRLHTSFSTCGAKLIENAALMMDLLRGCTEINLRYLILLPTHQCTLQCMEHAEMCFIDTQTFPISILCGVKLHSEGVSLRYINGPNRTETPDAQTPYRLRQY